MFTHAFFPKPTVTVCIRELHTKQVNTAKGAKLLAEIPEKLVCFTAGGLTCLPGLLSIFAVTAMA